MSVCLRSSVTDSCVDAIQYQNKSSIRKMEHTDESKKKHFIVPGDLEAARMLEKHSHEIVEISRYAFKEEDVLLHQLFNEWFKRPFPSIFNQRVT